MSHFSSPSVFQTVTFANLPTAATSNAGMIFNVSDVGVNGSLWRSNGTLWSPLNGSVTLLQHGGPWVVLSSGSVSAAGALTGITALLVAHAKAWVYLPANIVATVAAAGWYYCTFAGTTTGTVFLDQPGATFPLSFPTSPTAVTDGKGAYTGVTTVAKLPTVAVPGNSMGKNGRLRMYASTWQTSSLPTMNFYLGSSANNVSVTGNTTVNDWVGSIQNAGVTNVQNGNITSFGAGTGAGSVSHANLYGINTTADTTTTLGITSNVATANQEIISFSITLENDGQ